MGNTAQQAVVSVPAQWRRPSGDVGKGKGALQAEVFSLGESGVGVNQKGSLEDIGRGGNHGSPAGGGEAGPAGTSANSRSSRWY